MSNSSDVEAAPSGSFATRRPVAILMVFLAAVVFGFFSYGRLPVQLMPDLSYPTVTVRTAHPGAAPEEVENDISRPLESALGVIGGLRRIHSVSRAGLSDVVLEFDWGTEMSDAVQDTLEKLDLVQLPRDADRPLILRFDPTLDPVLELSLATGRTDVPPEEELRRLRRLAERQVKRELEPIPGVAAVRVRGGLEEEIQVLLDAGRLRQVGLGVGDVVARLQEENVNLAGGSILEGRTEYMVRTLNEYGGLEQVASTIVARKDGRDLRVSDVGTVVRAHADRRMATRTDGADSVQIEIFKEADANIVALAARVRAAVGSLAPKAQDGDEGQGLSGTGLAGRLESDESARLSVVADRSVFIESSIAEVRQTAVLGGLLAIAILFVFLRNVKSTLIVALSIPISLLITFAPLNLAGLSLNIMSLGGLALGIGMLVDSSIVTLESIYRCREEGDGVVAATVRGVREVRSAVAASIFTSIAVFLPMVFVEGVAGQAFADLGLAVVLALLVSLAVALWFIPMLASRQGLQAEGSSAVRSPGLESLRRFREDRRSLTGLRRRLLAPWHALRLALAFPLELLGRTLVGLLRLGALAVKRWLAPAAAGALRLVAWLPLKLSELVLGGLSRAYPALLRTALDHPVVMLVAMIGCGALTLHALNQLDAELLPEVHQGEFTVEVALPVGTALERTEGALAPIERAILEEVPGIESLILTFGYDPENARRSDEGEHSARFKVLLEPSRDAEAAEREAVANLRRRFAEVPDLQARVVRPVLFSFRTPIEVEVHGDDLVQLRRMADAVAAEMQAMPELADVESSLRRGAPEVQILQDRELLLRYGLNVRQVAERVRDEVRGRTATRLNEGDQQVPIVVRLREEDRASVEDIRELVVNPGSERSITLAAIASVGLGEGPSEVRRVDGNRVAVVSAGIGDASLEEAVTAIERRLHSSIDWPANMSFLVSGQNEEWTRSRSSLALALGLSVFLVFVIMAAQFESLLHPLIIMASIPLSFLGSFAVLWALGISLSVVVLLGLIMLAGIVVNNAIVLVDYANRLRARGLPLREALVTAGSVRLRPILMTTATTVLGLLPMALGLGDGAEIRTPMALTVISGLVVSTALTLVFVPVLYAIAESLRERGLGLLGLSATSAPPAAEAEALAP
jgi:HAE1 family hydrophobic/amphiphilic exporter-1